jgi:hypothetical protein
VQNLRGKALAMLFTVCSRKKSNMSAYFGALKDEELLEGLEEDYKK